MSVPLATVVMSAFNGEVYLPEAIESVLHQTFRDFEFVIVDDGSTDRTPEILTAYQRQDDRIRVLSDGRRGRAAALNAGISAARGKYIANTDADDVSTPRRLEEQIAFMEGNPEVGLLGGAFERVTNDGTVIDLVCPASDDAEVRSLLVRYNPVCHSSVMMRKDLVIELGGYRQPFVPSEDYDLWLRISERSKIANLQSVLLRYRVHGDQMSICKIQTQTLCSMGAVAAAEQRRKGLPDPLGDTQEITPQFLESLGVSSQTIHKAIVDTHQWWIHRLQVAAPEAALELVKSLAELSDSGPVEPAVLANAWLAAARIHYKQRDRAQAAACAGRALLADPHILTRPPRRIWNRLLSGVRGRTRPSPLPSDCVGRGN